MRGGGRMRGGERMRGGGAAVWMITSFPQPEDRRGMTVLTHTHIHTRTYTHIHTRTYTQILDVEAPMQQTGRWWTKFQSTEH